MSAEASFLSAAPNGESVSTRRGVHRPPVRRLSFARCSPSYRSTRIDPILTSSRSSLSRYLASVRSLSRRGSAGRVRAGRHRRRRARPWRRCSPDPAVGNLVRRDVESHARVVAEDGDQVGIRLRRTLEESVAVPIPHSNGPERPVRPPGRDPDGDRRLVQEGFDLLLGPGATELGRVRDIHADSGKVRAVSGRSGGPVVQRSVVCGGLVVAGRTQRATRRFPSPSRPRSGLRSRSRPAGRGTCRSGLSLDRREVGDERRPLALAHLEGLL